MDDLWQQFHRLPKAIRDAVARPVALSAVDSLEQRYPSLDLATFVMRVVVKDFPITEIELRLVSDFHLKESEAKMVADELMTTVFAGITDYLGVKPAIQPIKPLPPANLPIAPLPPGIPVVTAPVPPAIPLAPIPVAPGMPSQPPIVAPVIPLPIPPARLVPPPLAAPQPFLVRPSAPSAPTAPIGPLAPTQAYSDDDAQEIAQQSRRLQDMATVPVMGLDAMAQQIITQHHLAFHDELLSKRAIAILKARLKDIRDADETLTMLVRGPKVGGLGLDPDIAKQVVASLENQAGIVKERGLVRPPELIAPPPPPPMPPLQGPQQIPQPPLYRTAASAATRPSMPPLPPGPVAPPEPVKPLPSIKRPVDIPLPPPMKLTPSSRPVVPKTPTVMTRERTIDRPAIADITRPVKTVGPAEEMRTLTLTEFRRLGQGANESTRRLLEKFKLLQNESFTLWSEAVNGWRQCEVYQLYLAMGRQSLEQAMGISEVIQQRAKNNELYLSEHEFTALADMNRQLQT